MIRRATETDISKMEMLILDDDGEIDVNTFIARNL